MQHRCYIPKYLYQHFQFSRWIHIFSRQSTKFDFYQQRSKKFVRNKLAISTHQLVPQRHCQFFQKQSTRCSLHEFYIAFQVCHHWYTLVYYENNTFRNINSQEWINVAKIESDIQYNIFEWCSGLTALITIAENVRSTIKYNLFDSLNLPYTIQIIPTRNIYFIFLTI